MTFIAPVPLTKAGVLAIIDTIDLLGDNFGDYGIDVKILEDNSGTDIFYASDAEVSTSSGTYVIKKTCALPSGVSSELKISFEIKAAPTDIVRGYVYRNGSPVGAIQTVTGGTYAQKVQTISGWSAGDDLELYLKHEGGTTSYAKNFRILGTVTSKSYQVV